MIRNRCSLNWFLIAVVIAWLPGCELPGMGSGAKTQADRLQRFYPQLSAGRFSVIADFEDPAHMQLFQISSASSLGNAVLDPRKGRSETGRACVAFTSGASGDTLVISNANATSWYLKRDWRPYNLLTASIFVPAPTEMEIGIGGGPGESREFFTTVQYLLPGWNNISVDLAHVAEKISLDDIQELRLRAKSVDKPQTFFIDDLVTADHRVEITGDPMNNTGNLYVQQVGQRLHVGAGGKFEIAFANGRIVQWFNLAVDPNRLKNLVERTALGPAPVVTEDQETSEDFSRWGSKEAADHSVIEASGVRAVIATRRQFFDNPFAPREAAAIHAARFTIYPTGQIYVDIESHANGAAWKPHQVLALNLHSGVEGEIEIGPNLNQLKTSSSLHQWAKNKAADSALLFVPAAGESKLQMSSQSDRRHVSILAKYDWPAGSASFRWRAHIWLSSSSDVTNAQFAARAADYGQLAPMTVEVGCAPSITSSRSDSFDFADGCFVLQGDRGRVRFTLDGRKRALYSPCFRVPGAATWNPWVYVNHLILREHAKSPDGSLVFQVPGEIRGRTEVEVLTPSDAATTP